MASGSHCYSIGRLVAARAAPEGFARDVLKWAAEKIPSYPDPSHRKYPWRPGEAAAKAMHAFDAGLLRPREMH